jgi:hypothetical protein
MSLSWRSRTSQNWLTEHYIVDCPQASIGLLDHCSSRRRMIFGIAVDRHRRPPEFPSEPQLSVNPEFARWVFLGESQDECALGGRQRPAFFDQYGVCHFCSRFVQKIFLANLDVGLKVG